MTSPWPADLSASPWLHSSLSHLWSFIPQAPFGLPHPSGSSLVNITLFMPWASRPPTAPQPFTRCVTLGLSSMALPDSPPVLTPHLSWSSPWIPRLHSGSSFHWIHCGLILYQLLCGHSLHLTGLFFCQYLCGLGLSPPSLLLMLDTSPFHHLGIVSVSKN